MNKHRRHQHPCPVLTCRCTCWCSHNAGCCARPGPRPVNPNRFHFPDPPDPSRSVPFYLTCPTSKLWARSAPSMTPASNSKPCSCCTTVAAHVTVEKRAMPSHAPLWRVSCELRQPGRPHSKPGSSRGFMSGGNPHIATVREGSDVMVRCCGCAACWCCCCSKGLCCTPGSLPPRSTAAACCGGGTDELGVASKGPEGSMPLCCLQILHNGRIKHVSRVR